jgi:hypothetical protein
VADIFTAMAAAVVKASVKIWLRDDAFGADVSASVTDRVRNKISGDLEQRGIQRFFEDLGVPVARRLRSLREIEFRRLPENEWAAAVLAAGDSFDHSRLTAKDLFTRDLDPLFLEQHIRRDSPRATRDLSEGGTEFYERLITEACAYVIEIADKLPHFQAGAFTQLLHRDRQILEHIDEALDRIPSREAGEPGFVTACRRHIATRLDRPELFGLDSEPRWYPLSLAYVSLRTEQQLKSGGHPVEDRLASEARLMLVGRAGSGKTTVLHWLAVSAARSNFTGSLANLNYHFPFFIRLRDYVGKQLPRPEEFLAGTASVLIDEVPRGWVRAQLDSGQALVLVDGVDELPSSERGPVAEWLGALTERFPNVRYVITARPTAVSDTWLADIGFARSSLEAMPPPLIQAFVRNWHKATRQQLTDTDERERLDSCERSLLANIARDRYLRDLADTPLLAGLLCALNRDVRFSLPRRRTEIYERSLAMLDQRDQARNITAGEVRLDLAAKTHLLADLALWMIRNAKTELDPAAVVSQVSRSLVGLPGADYQPDAVFRFLLERSGLLREPAARSVDFVDRTFQEFLAAKAAVDGDAIGELIANAGNDQWREVVVLSAGQASRAQAEQLLRGLLRRDRCGQQRYERRVLAVACIQEVRSLDPSLRLEVESIIPGLLPPRSMEQAEQLSASGEPLLPLLASRWSRDRGKAEETIRAASLIGGPAAMNLIRDVARQKAVSPSVGYEVCRAWQYFDPDDFAQRVLASQEWPYLFIEDVDYERALRHVSSVKLLSIRANYDRAIDLDMISPLQALEGLYLDFAREVHSLWKLAACHEIRWIGFNAIRHVDLTDFTLIKPGLEVSFLDCGDVDLAPLASLGRLTIEYGKDTRLYHAEMLSEGSTVRKARSRPGSLWPFS